MSGEPSNAGSTALSAEPVIAKAQVIRDLRRRRAECFPMAASLLNDPVWDILLHLFVDQARGDRSITAAAVASGVQPTTARRWMLALDEAGLVVCTISDRQDDVRIGAAGITAMTRYLASFEGLSLVADEPSSPAG